MLTIVIAEDAPHDTALLAGALRRYSRERGVPIAVTHHADGAGLLAGYDSDADLLLLDVELPDADGLAAAAEIRSRDKRVAIAFVTNAAGRAAQGFEVEALDFLVKPVRYEALARTVDRVLARSPRTRSVLLPAEGRHLRLDADDIVLLEAAGRRVVVHTLDGRYVVRGPLKDVAASVADLGFFRCHHGYVVNLRHVVAARQETCALVTGRTVPVSRPRRSAFLAALTDHLALARG
ncbi:LytR/AlgR family response regulator transcription factor [Cellulomonas sp. Marseille-Q8402]